MKLLIENRNQLDLNLFKSALMGFSVCMCQDPQRAIHFIISLICLPVPHWQLSLFLSLLCQLSSNRERTVVGLCPTVTVSEIVTINIKDSYVYTCPWGLSSVGRQEVGRTFLEVLEWGLGVGVKPQLLSFRDSNQLCAFRVMEPLSAWALIHWSPWGCPFIWSWKRERGGGAEEKELGEFSTNSSRCVLYSCDDSLGEFSRWGLVSKQV